MNARQTREDFVRNCKGAAASIILLLLCSDGASLTQEELQAGTNYSDKPVKDALAYLEPRGVVQYNGHYHGWSLATGARQLDFIRELLQSGIAGVLPSPAPLLDQASHEADQEFETAPHGAGQQTAGNGLDVGNIPKTNNGDRKDSDLSHVCMSFKHQHDEPENIHAKHDNGQSRKDSDLRAVLKLVGIKGKNLDSLAASGLPASWPLAWWFDIQQQGWAKNPAGWIYKRLAGRKRPGPKFLDKAEAHLQECGNDLSLPQEDNGRCPDCGKELNGNECLYCAGVILR